MNVQKELLARLEILIEKTAIQKTPEQAMAIIQGVAASPIATNPDQWIELIKQNPAPDTIAELTEMLEIFRKQPDGIDGQMTHSERINSFREELLRHGLSGFIIPRGDEHQGENVARASERLRWLTGFSGSAGQAVVTTDKAAIFIDGRYTLQVKNQVDARLFEFRHLTQQPLSAWISENLNEGQRLGYDAWLHTKNQVETLKKACQKVGCELKAVEQNPVDAIWHNQPALPISPVVPHDTRYSGQSSKDKRKQVAGILEKSAAGATVLSAPDSIAWLLNIRGGDVPNTPLPLSFLILHTDGRAELIIDPLKVLPETLDHLGPDITLIPREQIGETLDKLGRANFPVCLETATIPDWIYTRISQTGAEIINAGDPCQRPKATKNEIEISGTRSAHKRDGASLTGFMRWLSEAAPKGGVTEMSAAQKLDGIRRNSALCTDLSFPTISGYGPNGAIVHYSVSDSSSAELKPGNLYLVDSGGQYLDGTTDVTRTVAIGEPTDEMRTHFTLVLKGHIALGTSRFPAMTTGSQLDAFARRALWQYGLDYDHGTGHGVGSYLSVHEGPQRISKVGSNIPLEPGMIISNEPGFYKTGEYGIRIENLVLVVESAEYSTPERPVYEFETLTLAPIDRNLVKVDLMDNQEKQWLNAYHKRVHETLSHELEGDAKRWLEQATRPI